MTVINLCNEVLENAIGVHRNLEKIEPLNPMDAVAVQAMEELLAYRAIGTIEEFKALKEAEKQRLLLKFPCHIGSTVWFVGNYFVNDYEVRRYIVDEAGIDCIQIAKEIDGRDYWNSFSVDSIGKTVFLTKEEAERALANRQGN